MPVPPPGGYTAVLQCCSFWVVPVPYPEGAMPINPVPVVGYLPFQPMNSFQPIHVAHNGFLETGQQNGAVQNFHGVQPALQTNYGVQPIPQTEFGFQLIPQTNSGFQPTLQTNGVQPILQTDNSFQPTLETDYGVQPYPQTNSGFQPPLQTDNGSQSPPNSNDGTRANPGTENGFVPTLHTDYGVQSTPLGNGFVPIRNKKRSYWPRYLRNRFVPFSQSETSSVSASTLSNQAPVTDPNGIVPVPDRVAQFALQSGMQVTQIHSQRFFGPPTCAEGSVEPPPGSELFIFGIPTNWEEPELVPFILFGGPFYQLRLMIAFSGRNKGYCYVMYCCPEHANDAMNRLKHHQFQTENGPKSVHVSLSTDNKRLVLSGIPTSKTPQAILNELQRLVHGVRWVDATWLKLKYSTPRGFIYAHFETHR